MKYSERCILSILALTGALSALLGTLSCVTTASGEPGLDLVKTRAILALACEELDLARSETDGELSNRLREVRSAVEILEVAVDEQLEAGESRGMSVSAAASAALRLLPRMADVGLEIPEGASPERIERLTRRQERIRLAVASLRAVVILLEAS